MAVPYRSPSCLVVPVGVLPGKDVRGTGCPDLSLQSHEGSAHTFSVDVLLLGPHLRRATLVDPGTSAHLLNRARAGSYESYRYVLLRISPLDQRNQWSTLYCPFIRST